MILETSDKGSISIDSNELSPAVSCRRAFVRWTNIVAFWDARTERHSRTFFRSRTKTGERDIPRGRRLSTFSSMNAR